MVKGKVKSTLWLTPSVKEKVEDHYSADNCQSQSEFIEKAIEFYIGYLHTQNAHAFLPKVLSNVLIGTMDNFGQRIGAQLYKAAIEQNMCNHILAADTDMDQRDYELLRGRSVREVQRTNGRIMDIARSEPENLAARAKAEKYAKILSKTIVNPNGDGSNRGQNAFFYDAADGLLTSVILMLAEFLPPDEKHPQERRHIVSVFKLVQDLLEPSKVKGKSHFQILMSKLPPDHKAKWFAGAALNSADQAMASVMSTVLSRLNAFLDSELEQILCFDSAIDAEKFASEKSAIFLILPEEDTTKNFMAGLMIQNLSRELFAVADENGGKLKNRVVLFCDEFGTMPPFDILPLFSAGRSRRLTLVPIIQSLAQLEKTTEKKAAKSFRTTARTPSSAVLRPTARQRKCCLKPWAAAPCCPAL